MFRPNSLLQVHKTKVMRKTDSKAERTYVAPEIEELKIDEHTSVLQVSCTDDEGTETPGSENED